MTLFHRASLIALAGLTAVVSCTKPGDSAPQKLAAPSPVLASAGIDNATIMWEAVKNAASYQVVVNDGSPIAAEGVSITIQNLTANTSYSLKMKAVAPAGSKEWLDSDFCTPISFSTAGKKPLASPELSATEVVSGGFTISWKAVKNAGKYVYKVGDGPENETLETSFTADGLKHSTQYSVRVKAVPSESMSEVALDSDWAELSVTTAQPSTLSAPVLSSGDIHTNGFTISWAPVPYAGKYNYKLDGGAVQTTTETSVAFNSLEALSEHTVEVMAVASDANADNYASSSWANIKVKTLDLVTLSAPQLKSENILATEFTVTWPVVEHAARYMCSLDGAAPVAVTTNSIKYEGLHTETAYSVTVYAEPSDSETGTYKSSPVSAINVTTKKGPSDDDKGGDLSDYTEQPVF